MSVFDAVFNKLDAITEVTGRVYHAEVLKTASAPFIFWLQQSESTEQTLGGYTDLNTTSYDINVVAEHLEQLETISEKVKSAVISLQQTVSGGILYERIDLSMVSPVINERLVGLYRKSFRVTINYQNN